MASKLKVASGIISAMADPSHTWLAVPSRSQAFLTIHSIDHILLLLKQKARK
jgi:hypothetical protein